MPTNRYISLIALLLALALALAGCSSATQSSPQMTNVVLPEPEVLQPQSIYGDDSTADSREVTLYYPAADGVSLNAVTQTIHVERDDSLIGNALAALLETAPAGGSAYGAALGVSLISLEYGCGIVTVNLSIDTAVNRSDQDYLLLCASIANTLLGIHGVEAVNILTGNRSDPMLMLPMGVFTQPVENIGAAYAQIHSEADRFLRDEGILISRNALLYFPSRNGAYLLPEVRTLSFDGDDYVSAMIAALGEGAQQRECCFPAIPGNLELLATPPEIRITESGERTVDLNFTGMITNYLAFAGVESWQLYGSIVLSLCSFVPEIDAVRISIDGAFISECPFNGINLQFEDGLMRRSDFASCIGSSGRLYFANEDDRLSSMEIPMSQSASLSATGLIKQLLSPFNPIDAALRSVFPDGITAEDILGISVENRTALVNLSGHFYARCQQLDAQQERLLIYAMVNTLAELDQIGAVAFLVEGEQVSSLAQNIYLREALMPDPGLVQEVSKTDASE